MYYIPILYVYILNYTGLHRFIHGTSLALVCNIFTILFQYYNNYTTVIRIIPYYFLINSV